MIDTSCNNKRDLTEIYESKVNKGDLAVKWSLCLCFIEKKRRYCNASRVFGSNFCGNHLTEEDVQKRIKAKVADYNGDSPINESKWERVPCPLDPTHKIYRHHLQKHLSICTFGKQEKKMINEVYYSKDCNAGNSLINDGPVHSAENSNKLNLAELVKKIEKCFEAIEKEIFQPTASKIDQFKMQSLTENIRKILKADDQTAFQHTKHVEQDVLLVHEMIANDLILTPTDESSTSSQQYNQVFIELGAGKGNLGLSAGCVDPTATITLVERAGNRRKADKFLKLQCERKYFRAKIDIRHCHFPKLPGCLMKVDEIQTEGRNRSNVVFMAKHLCGVASDYAFRGIQPFFSKDEGSTSKTEASSSRHVIAIATCCHHACNYTDYVGKEFLHLHGISSEKEFNALKTWSGWACVDRILPDRQPKDQNITDNNSKSKNQDFDHNFSIREDYSKSVRPEGITTAEMASIGKKVKRILDFGRIWYLRNNLGLDAKLIRYCDPELSPECMLIAAKPII